LTLKTRDDAASAVPHDVASPESIAKQRIIPMSYWRLLLKSGEREEAEFSSEMVELLGQETHVFPVGRARAGIYLLAKLATTGRRRKFILSPYTIPDVVTMVRLAGATPVFYDFMPDSTACDVEALASLIDAETAAVMITHYHVNEPSLDKIAAICRENGIYLFDDCAIAFGGTVEGRRVGTLTDASVESFSSFKLVNYFWGGAITTANSELAQGISEIIADWPRLRSKDYFAPAQAVLKYDVASRPPVFGSLVFPRFRDRARRSSAPAGLEHTRIETEELNSTLMSRPALEAFAEWSPKLARIEESLARRRVIAEIYRDYLGSEMVSSGAAEGRVDGGCFVNFPVLAPQDGRDEIARRMIAGGYDVGRSLYPNCHAHPRFRDMDGRSDNVANLVSRVIYLPTHFGVPEEYAHRIATFLKHLLCSR
jgi:dTDP-4-amino-4,6-dideoxygalactose transaminase